MNSSLLIVDLSYYNFYRFFATKQWYTRANPDDTFESNYDWSQNEEFWLKFKKMFLQNLDEYRKKLKVTQIIFAKDCPRKDIWRLPFFPEYKANREINYAKTEFQGGKVFKRCYTEILPELLDQPNSIYRMYQVDHLEADDIIYLLVNKYSTLYNKVYVVSSDHDLLQMVPNYSNLDLVDSKMKSYREKAMPKAIDNVFMKAILGDGSDNIPKSLDKVGDKTAEKMVVDYSLLLAKFRQQKDAFTRFATNKCLVDFSHIPQIHIDNFNKLF
jgi:5'-3' exonuclease